MAWAKVKPEGGSVAFTSSYDPLLIAALKASMPGNDRRPVYKNNRFSHWLVETKHVPLLGKLVKQHLGIRLDGIPGVMQVGVQQAAKSANETKLFKVLYIGVPKDRGTGALVAYGLVGDDWNVAFPEQALRDFFECGLGNKKQSKPSGNTTRYALLAIAHDAPDNDIKRAYRVMAKRWHPDVNRDEDAPEMFRKIQKAYETLSNPLERRRYDAGLFFQESTQKQQPVNPYRFSSTIYRPPIRCGLFLCVGQWRVGRFHVEKIIQREEILNQSGKMMTSFWDKTLQEVVMSWV